MINQGKRGQQKLEREASEYEKKLSLLAEARGASREDTADRFSYGQVIKTPSFSKHLAAVRAQEFSGFGLEDGVARVDLPDGHRFFSPRSHDSMQRQFDYVGDTLDAKITSDTLLAAIDVVQRYVTDKAWPSSEIFSPHRAGSSVIELGAYLGHKTVRFAELVAPLGGKVLAVEMMEDNCRILKMNIDANGLNDVVDIRQVGVWKSSGTVAGIGKGRQRRSIHRLEQLEGGAEAFQARVVSLPEILAEWGRNPVDLVFATVNGAEVEMLEGYTPAGVEVKAWFIAAPYGRNLDGTTGAELCFDHLVALGYEPLSRRGQQRIEAKLCS